MLTIELLRTGAIADESKIETYSIPYAPRMRVLDALNEIALKLAPDLAYRWLCGSKMCGTCAVRMNGREVLACWEAVEPTMRLEPLRNLPVIRDLIVDRAPYEARVASLEPWIVRGNEYPGFPEPLTATQMRHASHALNCISCMACYSACPVVGLGDLTQFSGPAVLVQFGQTALDPRNNDAHVLRGLQTADVFNCVSCYKCEEVCPVRIPVVSQVIEPLKRLAYRMGLKESKHATTFRAIVARRGWIEPLELVLRVQGIRAVLRPRRVIRLLLRGKVHPLRLLTGWGAKARIAVLALRNF